jgi:ABC-type nitrate/sulfonate/bicarbonate transport system permease component
MTGRRLRSTVNGVGWLVVLALVAVWQLLVATGALDFSYLPAPTGVADGLAEVWGAGAFWSTIGHTLTTTVIATALALCIGVLAGAAIGLVAPVRAVSMASIDVLRTLPTVALMPLALLVWGPALTAELVVTTWAATWPILVNVAGGVRAVHPTLHDVSATFQLSRWAKLRRIVVPAALPEIVVGARLAVINALVVAIVAEMLINPEGLGWGLVGAMQGLQPEQMWAWAAITGLIGYGLNVLLLRLVRLAMPGAAARTSGGAA